MKIDCDKCGGSGRVKREDWEADVVHHPIVSQHLGVCDKCGGGGKVLTSTYQVKIEETKPPEPAISCLGARFCIYF